MPKTFQTVVSNYKNDLESNHFIWQEFARKTDEVDFLKIHRDHIEKNKLGFGDRSFHYMWYLLMKDLAGRKTDIRALEIGVFKGQVLSLWKLLGQNLNLNLEIAGVSPLRGNVPKSKILYNKLIRKIRCILDPEFKKLHEAGNIYIDQDYRLIIEKLFNDFDLNLAGVDLIKGMSQDPPVLEKVRSQTYDLIYIDGDHSYEAVICDLKNMTPLIVSGGYLVMDDASYFLEGNIYFKGHKEVSEACKIIEDLGFKNVLNVGHNRIYQKV